MNNLKDIVKKDSIYLTNNKDVVLHGRLEKIVTAVYMVTNFFPNEEPLKFKIREKNIELMSFKNLSEKYFEKIILLISEIESLLKISLVSKNISEMNYLVLSQEYKNITNFIIEQNNKRKEIFLLDNFFDKENFTENEKKEKEDKEIIRDKISKGHYKGQNQIQKDTIKDTKRVFTKKDKNVFLKLPVGNGKQNIAVKNDRKDLIIKFIKDKKEVSVKDILNVIKDCSEKTIQRDLVNLVNHNVLKKVGERRWSRYSLK